LGLYTKESYVKSKIPRFAIPRLSIYYRALILYDKGGVISSDKLSELTGYTAAQIRRDIAYFGQFGTPGRGYIVNDLKKQILKILGIDKLWDVALVGVGNLGTALLSYKGFKQQGFKIVAVFDNDKRKVGVKAGGVTLQHIKELHKTVRKKGIQMAIVAVPAQEAQVTIDSLTKAGVKAVLNFAPIRPKCPASVELINIDLSIELEKLAHFLGRRV
jgi:redox-sensing transcriptional repressor